MLTKRPDAKRSVPLSLYKEVKVNLHYRHRRLVFFFFFSGTEARTVSMQTTVEQAVASGGRVRESPL